MRRGPGVAGTITAISDTSITVKTRDGKTEQVNLSGETKFRKERQDAKITDFKVGDEIFVRGQSAGADTWTAEVVAGRPRAADSLNSACAKAWAKNSSLEKSPPSTACSSPSSGPMVFRRPSPPTRATSFRKQQESITLG